MNSSYDEVICFARARLIDGTGRAPQEDFGVAVKGSEIVEVGKTKEIESSFPRAEMLDLSGMTLMPGLIDPHVHVSYTSYSSYFDLVPPEKSLESITLQALKNANEHLQSGYTTIRDIGSIQNVALAVRDAIKAGLFDGPRMIATGKFIGATGGFPDYYPEWLEWLVPRMVSKLTFAKIVDGPEQVVTAVREIIKSGADFIKIAGTGGVDNPTVPSEMSSFTLEEIAAACGEAHRHGKKVAIHAEGTEGIKFALQAGADTIEHGFFLNDSIIQTWKSSNTFLVATIGYLRRAAEKGEEKNVPRWLIERKSQVYEHYAKYLPKALQAGVKIALGSDCGAVEYPHGNTAYELQQAVKIGFTELDAIRAATMRASEAIGLGDKIGTVEKGKLADLIAVEGDPTLDITILQRREKLKLILKDGRFVKKAI
jgi:imidazolonepropionase-like amidohydrolase